MARKTYTSAVEAYIDAELAAATDERSRVSSTASVVGVGLIDHFGRHAL